MDNGSTTLEQRMEFAASSDAADVLEEPPVDLEAEMAKVNAASEGFTAGAFDALG